MTEFQKTGASSSGGFVLIYRSLLNHHAFRSDSEAMAFAWLVLRASWKETEVRYKDRNLTLQRGQVAVSVRDMATKLDRSKDWANRFLKRLIERDMISVSDETGVSVISIKNYNNFQLDPAGACDTAATGPRQDRDRAATQNNEVNKGKEEKEKKPVARKTRLNEDWVLPDEWRDLAKSTKGWTDADVQAEADRFRDYWVNDTSTNALKADWKKTWINWIGRSNRRPNTALRSTMSVKEAQARVNELHSNMSWWNQCMKKAREQNNQEDFDKYSGFYLKCREERQSLEKAFNITSTWS